MSLRQTFAPIVDFVFPPRCPACGEAIIADAQGDDALCAACWTRLRLPGEPSCATCQHPFGADHFGAEAQCARCLAQPPVHDGIVAATIYGDVSRDLVLALKHGGRIALARAMGRSLAARIGDRAGASPIVVPVPLHRGRLWRRGYNQSALIAGSLARAREWRVMPDLLRRVRATPTLGGLNPQQRRETLAGAMVVRKGMEPVLRDTTVVLVDDVLTSGATSDACVGALRRAGAARIVVACYARVVAGDPVTPLPAATAAQAEGPGTDGSGHPA